MFTEKSLHYSLVELLHSALLRESSLYTTNFEMHVKHYFFNVLALSGTIWQNIGIAVSNSLKDCVWENGNDEVSTRGCPHFLHKTSTS